MLHRDTELWVVAGLAAIAIVGCGSSSRTTGAATSPPYAATQTETSTVTATATATSPTQSASETTGNGSTDTTTATDTSGTDQTDTTDTGGPGTTDTTATDAASASQTCAIKAWYSTIDIGMVASQYIHFKCVDEATGTTVAEAPGSDNIDTSQEAQGPVKNSAREALVNTLQRSLEADGWKLIGPAPEGLWYELRFSR